jgi:hypothetical protein
MARNARRTAVARRHQPLNTVNDSGTSANYRIELLGSDIEAAMQTGGPASAKIGAKISWQDLTPAGIIRLGSVVERPLLTQRCTRVANSSENPSDLDYTDTLWQAADKLRGTVDAAE